MPVKHREFLEYLETISCVRQFVVDNLAIHEVVVEAEKQSSDSKELPLDALKRLKDQKVSA